MKNAMSTGHQGFKIDTFTVLGLFIAAWLAVTAWLLFRPPAEVSAGAEEPIVTENASAQQQESGPAKEKVGPTPLSQEEAKIVNKALEEQPNNPIVRIETTEGPVLARLFVDRAPITAENFIDLVKQEFYDGIIFHRVIKEFMIQTGDPKGTGTGGRTDKGLPPKKLKDEFHPELRHDRPGILSMANAGPNTGDSQFFITTVPTPWLDDRHAIFGEVIHGMDIITKIENAPTGRQDRPVDPPKMVRVRVIDAEEAKKTASG